LSRPSIYFLWSLLPSFERNSCRLSLIAKKIASRISSNLAQRQLGHNPSSLD
jgi:hypothetical protein